MKNKTADKLIVILITLIIFAFPFLLITIFLSPVFLILLVSPASSILYLLIKIKNKNKKQNGTHSNSLKYGRIIRFPFIIVGFALIPLIVSFAIAFTEGIDYYTVIILMGVSALFVTTSFFIPLSVFEKYFTKKDNTVFFFPPVTIIIPAYNEENGITRTLDSLVEVDYPNKEVIVVDDGSTDRTYQIALRHKNKFQNKGITYSVFQKKNGGKSSAINYATRLSQNEIIVVIDADSVINRNAIKSLSKHFYDNDVVAVGGYIRGLDFNSNNVLQNCTTLELVNAVNVTGRAYGLLGSVMIVPGALGAFRKRTVIQRGMYDKDNITEDFDITVKILKSGGKVKFEEEALTYTEIPNNLKNLYNQRKRWNVGNIRTLTKHANILSNSSYGFLHQFGYPMTLLLFIYRPIWSTIVPVAIVLSIIYGIYIPVVLSLMMFLSLSFLLSVISIIMDEQKGRSKLVLYSPFMVIGYQQILDIIIIKSIIDVLFRRNVKWASIKRIKRP